jgi:Fe2+ or Zn2+ uptake regulation protein
MLNSDKEWFDVISLGEIENKVRDQGYKLTRNRRILLQGLLEMKDWATAQEIFQYVAARNRRVNFSTIYRNLDTLCALGLLCRVDNSHSGHYYTLNLDQSHHHHLICKSCRKIMTLEYCPLNALNPQDLHSFSDLECKFDVYGYCQNCQNQR